MMDAVEDDGDEDFEDEPDEATQKKNQPVIQAKRQNQRKQIIRHKHIRCHSQVC